MEQMKFDSVDFKEKTKKMKQEVDELTELKCFEIPYCSITSPSIDKIISVYEAFEQDIDNYVIALESMIESMKQVQITLETVDSQWAEVINA